MAQQPLNSNFRLRSGLTLYPEQHQALSQFLTNLAQKLPAHLVLLTDLSGQVISAHANESINLVALSALVAGDLAASQEIARLCGEYETHQLILREGQKNRTFIAEGGPHLILLVQLSNTVPMGWARLLILEAAGQLAELLAALPPAPETPPLALDQTEFEELFDSVLDDLWMEDADVH